MLEYLFSAPGKKKIGICTATITYQYEQQKALELSILTNKPSPSQNKNCHT